MTDDEAWERSYQFRLYYDKAFAAAEGRRRFKARWSEPDGKGGYRYSDELVNTLRSMIKPYTGTTSKMDWDFTSTRKGTNS
jgi:hypothetical protein